MLASRMYTVYCLWYGSLASIEIDLKTEELNDSDYPEGFALGENSGSDY